MGDEQCDRVGEEVTMGFQILSRMANSSLQEFVNSDVCMGTDG
jgi:hypothetical protein